MAGTRKAARHTLTAAVAEARFGVDSSTLCSFDFLLDDDDDESPSPATCQEMGVTPRKRGTNLAKSPLLMSRSPMPGHVGQQSPTTAGEGSGCVSAAGPAGLGHVNAHPSA